MKRTFISVKSRLTRHYFLKNFAMSNSATYSQAIEPLYATETPNQAISLYEGEIKLIQNDKEATVPQGRIYLRWLPRPIVWFDAHVSGDRTDAPLPLVLGEAQLVTGNFTSLASIAEAPMTFADTSSYRYAGYLGEDIESGDRSAPCGHIVFHLPNFVSNLGEPIRDEERVWLGRLTLEHKEWRVILDKNRYADDVFTDLKSVGGYALTHTGLLERIDGNPFTHDEAKEVLEALRYFLSFVRGAWCGPCLLVGFSADQAIWQQWRLSLTRPYDRFVHSWWFPHPNHTEIAKLSTAFDGFLSKWFDPVWQTAIKRAIHWYLEANWQAGQIDGAIVLTQAGLELLSYVYAVANKKTKSDSFAAGNIRQFLQYTNVPVGIPASFSSLDQWRRNKNRNLLNQKKKKTYQLTDSIDVFVAIRNSLVHADPTGGFSDPQALVDAWYIGIWFLELALLWLFGYEGHYLSRLKRGLHFPKEIMVKVPWV